MGPTLNGGIRINAESSSDWEVLRGIVSYAEPDQLAAHLTDATGPHGEGWHEYVQPDLLKAFQDQLGLVRRAIAEANAEAADGPGPLFIQKADAEAWYGALNQARFALEARYAFADPNLDLFEMEEEKRSAFFRDDFYGDVQKLLLDRVMGG